MDAVLLFVYIISLFVVVLARHRAPGGIESEKHYCWAKINKWYAGTDAVHMIHNRNKNVVCINFISDVDLPIFSMSSTLHPIRRVHWLIDTNAQTENIFHRKRSHQIRIWKFSRAYANKLKLSQGKIYKRWRRRLVVFKPKIIASFHFTSTLRLYFFLIKYVRWLISIYS